VNGNQSIFLQIRRYFKNIIQLSFAGQNVALQCSADSQAAGFSTSGVTDQVSALVQRCVHICDSEVFRSNLSRDTGYPKGDSPASSME
jgi:hypothetical protein